MRLKFALFAATFALAAAASAAPDPFDYHVANMRLLQSKPVQKEIGLTEAQRKRMNVFAERHTKDVQGYMAKLKKEGKDPAKIPQPDKNLLAYFRKLKDGVASVLSAKQLRRLREVSLQQAGLIAALDDVVARRMGVSKPQLERLRNVYRDGLKQATDLEKAEVQAALASFKDAKPKNEKEKQELRTAAQAKLKSAMEKLQPRVTSIRDQTKKKMLDILTPAQEKVWAEIQGTPFRPKT